MSLVASDSFDVESVVEVSLKEMAKLQIGSCSVCTEACGCREKRKKEGKESSFPYFWRKTQNNPISKTSATSKKPGSSTRLKKPILRPSGLKFIVSSPTPPTAVILDSSFISSSSPGGEVSSSCGRLASSPAFRSSSMPELSSLVPINASSTLSTSSSELLGDQLLPLPDFTTLSLQSKNDERGCPEGSVGVGSNEGCQITDSNQNVALELSGALLNFKLETRSRTRYGGRNSKWKKHMKGLFKPRSTLHPILEDTEADGLSSSSSANHPATSHSHSSSSNNSSSSNLNCGQQALMENNGGTFSDPIDDVSIDELASYLDVFLFIPKKMSPMAEMMYT